jgi:hypothetical protein
LQLDARDESKQPIAADGKREQIGVFIARAVPDGSIGTEQVEAHDLLDDRLERQAPAMRVARQRAADAETIGARLLLRDAPLSRPALLRLLEMRQQGGPLDAPFDGDDPRFFVEGDDAIERARIDQQRVSGELLATHRMTAAGDGNRAAGRDCAADRGVQSVHGLGLDDLRNPRRVEL